MRSLYIALSCQSLWWVCDLCRPLLVTVSKYFKSNTKENNLVNCFARCRFRGCPSSCHFIATFFSLSWIFEHADPYLFLNVTSALHRFCFSFVCQVYHFPCSHIGSSACLACALFQALCWADKGSEVQLREISCVNSSKCQW